jgi:hypothetical protein
MTDFSRTPEHLALGRRAAAEVLDRVVRLDEVAHAKPAQESPHGRHHRLRDLFGRAA